MLNVDVWMWLCKDGAVSFEVMEASRIRFRNLADPPEIAARERSGL